MEHNTVIETPTTPSPRGLKRVARPQFFEGPSAQEIVSVLTYCKAYGTMGLVAGGPGVGKTTSTDHLSRLYENVWVFTAHPNVSTNYQALRGLAAVLGVPRTTSQAGFDLWEEVCRRVKGQKGLIVVDEAQHLKIGALETLRSVHDATDVGLVFVGDLELFRSIMSRAQLSSRVTARCQIASPTEKDIAQMASAWGIKDARTIALLAKVARTPGGLRVATQAIRDAVASADELTQESVRAAIRLLGVEVEK